MSDTVAAQLLSLLQEERAAIRTAAYDRLDTLSDRKIALFDELANVKVQQPFLAQIQSGLAENQALLASAIAGVAAARTRLAALESVRDELSYYDKSGQISKVTRQRQDLEKKA